MIVPQYWAESRTQVRREGRQVTVRRFGWSDVSPQDAQAQADARAQEALERILSGENLRRREPKLAYNGAEGVPIREEIVSRQGETVITRNIYGALCLNTPNVLFADIDLQIDPSCRLTLFTFLAMVCGAAATGFATESRALGIVLGLVALILSGTVARGLLRLRQQIGGGAEQVARRRIARFVERHPHWSLRLYRTPAGLRVLATHQTFEPSDSAVTECFTAWDTDPIYVRMCLHQQCFRARVSPKPWRIGIRDHLRPRPGVWPVAPEHLPGRNAWIATYEAAAAPFAACEWIDSLGSGLVHPDVRPVLELHDELSRATQQLPLA
jgi:hypothetical protein